MDNISYSFIMLKPDAIYRSLVKEIMLVFRREYFSIEYINCLIAESEMIYKHYEHLLEEYGESFRLKINEYFIGKPVIPIIISMPGGNAIARVRDIVGATDPSQAAKGTIRGDYGIDNASKAKAENRCCYNLLHASDSPRNFYREIKIWFDNIDIDIEGGLYV